MDRDVILQYVNRHFSMYFEVEDDFYNILTTIQFPFSARPFFNLKEAKPKDIKWKRWEGENLPILFDLETDIDWFEIKDNQLVFHYDIPSSIFYFLSGWQEEHCGTSDHFGRFPYSQSIQKDYNFVTRPVVNYYFFILQKGIETLLKKPLSLKQKFRFNMTHDIDLVNSGWKSAIKKQLLKGHLIQAAAIAFRKLIKGIDPYQNLEELMELEKEHGIQSIFYFLPKNDCQKGIQNADYEINQPYIQKIINKINADSNFELGLHTPSLNSLNKETIESSIQALAGNIKTNRFHYLALQQRDLNHFENTSIETDSSLGFAEHIGFRHSVAWLFHPFNFKENRAMRILEYPLVIMDVTLTNSNYMNLSAEDSLKSIKKLINVTREVNGIVTLLWHNDNIAHSPKYFRTILNLT